MYHILRTCLPSQTAVAANRLDNLVIKFYMRITKIDTDYDNLPQQDKEKLINKIFLSINRGGIGITSSARTAKAAFTGSICLCANWMGRIAPELIIPTDNEDHPSLQLPIFKEFNNIVKDFQAIMPKQNAVQEIDIYDIWNSQSSGIQHILNNELQEQALLELESTLPITSTEYPNSRYSQLTQNDKVTIIQHIQNKDTISSAWLQSNPIDYDSHMDNSSFIISSKQRLNVHTIADRTHCNCRTKLDRTGTHFFACNNQANQNSIRNSAHKYLKDLLITLIEKINKDTSNNMHILKFEPEMDQYYPSARHTQSHTTATTQHNVNTNITTINKRADFTITNGSETILIDVTIVEATAQYIKQHNKADAPANQRAEIKMNQYNQTHNMKEPFNANTKFFIASTTTQAAMGKQFISLFQHLVKSYPENIRKI